MQLQTSRHNIISPLGNGNEYLIVNVLSGNADILSAEEYKILQQKNFVNPPPEFIQKGYVVNPGDEEMQYRLKYIEFLEERDKEELQLFFVPTYACNFTCSYCYQSEYPHQNQTLTPEVTNAFFNFIAEKFGDRKKYVTIFGGEPLLKSIPYQQSIYHFIEQARKNKLDLAIVTNGYYLDEYLPVLESSFVREIQITLDGTAPVHDKRRRLKDESPTFNKIVENIDACLQKQIPVNLRMVVDKDNIDNLPELAAFAKEKNWTANPLFKTQIGRNYELHYCQNGHSKLFTRLSLYEKMLKLIQDHPQIIEFHKPAFSAIKFLQENEKLPDALFDACPACKSEWAMDFSGNIYSCTATVGKPGEKLGSFYPAVKLNEEKIQQWQQRDVMHIEKCKQCNVQLICGGGCGSIAFNETNSILAPDCRPIEKLHSLGAEAYFSSNQ